MNSFAFKHLTAAAHTPFTEDQRFNPSVIEKQAAHYMSQNIQTTFIGGSTGESHSLSLAERLELTRRWMEVTQGTSLQVVVAHQRF